jgi:Uma2 family endonuclease
MICFLLVDALPGAIVEQTAGNKITMEFRIAAVGPAGPGRPTPVVEPSAFRLYPPRMTQRLSRAEFHQWAEAQPRGRFERVDGTVVAMAPERWIHARLKARIWRALDREVIAAGLPCQAAPDGMTVEIDQDTDYEPDALLNCGPPIPDDATAAPNPVVIVEVLSPGTAHVDAGEKLADYFRLPSVQHYLLVRPTRREVIHHRRVGERIETLIVRDGCIDLTPPGIGLAIDEIYGA